MAVMHGDICRLVLASLAVAINCTTLAFAAEPSPTSLTSAPECDRPLPIAPASTTNPDQAAAQLDPLETFQQVVDRYHRIITYKDSVRMVQTTQRDGEESHSVETKLSCEIADGKLRVETAASAIRHALGIEIADAGAAVVEKAKLKYDLWLAPHMAMRFANQPLKELRAGVEEGFTATGAESVIVDNRRMVHVALKSGDGLSEDCSARFDLFINPESMLIERIDGEQRTADGVHCQTSLHITPIRFESEEEEPSQPTT